VSGQLYAPTAFTPCKRATSSNWVCGWVGLW